MVFAGLSLINPELLSIDPSIYVSEPESARRYPQLLFPRRKDYTRPITPFGVKWQYRVMNHDPSGSSIDRLSALPKGLWPVLAADYDADLAEVLVNTAACLLTHTGARELLSIAARTSHPDKYTSEWFVSPGDRLDLDGLPSWVPAPGSWTSRVNKLLIHEPCAAINLRDDVNSEFQISHNGSTLHLEASSFDTIDSLLLGDKFLHDLTVEQLTELLSTLSSFAHKGLLAHGDSLIPALSRVLESNGKMTRSLNSPYAPEWLCHVLAFAAFDRMRWERMRVLLMRPHRQDYPGISSDEYADKLIEYYKEKSMNVDKLLDAFSKICMTYPNEIWPKWTSPRKLDREVHIIHMRGEADQEKHSQDKKAHLVSRDNIDESHNTECPAAKDKASNLQELQNDQYAPRDPNAHARLSACASSTLTWRKVFVTSQGHIGLGPDWLTGGETIMHVRGASVPYVFIPQAVDQISREKWLREALDVNDAKYFEVVKKLGEARGKLIWRPVEAIGRKRAEGKKMRLDEERGVLREKLKRLEREKRQEDAWVLQGEVYIEGLMGQGVDVKGPWRRIQIV